MELLSYSDLVKAKELDDLYTSGNRENGKIMDAGFMAKKHIRNMIFPSLKNLGGHITHHALFENVVFNNINLYGMDLSLSTFKSCVFEGCSLTKSELIRSKLFNCIFNNSKLFRTKFIDAELENCSFVKCNVQYMMLTETKLKNVIFTGDMEGLNNGGDNEEENVIWDIQNPK